MMNYMWDEEAHQQFLRIKHPNYYAMDHEEHKRKFEEAKQKAVNDALERIARTIGGMGGGDGTVGTTVIGQETIDVEYEVVSTTHNTHDDQGTDKDSAQRGEGKGLLEQGA